MSIMAWIGAASWIASASRMRGVNSRCFPSKLPPSAPVTSNQSPGFAPDRGTGPRSVASPNIVTEMASGWFHVMASPPTIGTSKASAASHNPR